MCNALASLGLLLMRLAAAGMIFFGHGLGKIQNFDKMSAEFYDPFNMGNKTSLIFAILGEAVCPVLVALGLLTRFAALGTAFTMGVAVFSFHMNDPLFPEGGAAKEMAILYLIPFGTLVFTGPGKASIDGFLFKSRKTLVTPPPASMRPI